MVFEWIREGDIARVEKRQTSFGKKRRVGSWVAYLVSRKIQVIRMAV